LRATGLRRSRLQSMQIWAERNWLAARHRDRARSTGRILCYHGVGTPQWGVNDLPPHRFRRHLELATQHGYRFVPAEQIARDGGHPGDLAITFDDGLASVIRNAAPILAESGAPWEVFVVTDWADGQSAAEGGTIMGWHDLTLLARDPRVTIGSHSVSHVRLNQLAPDALRRELQESRRVLESRLGLPIRSLAIPFGQSGDWSPECQSMALDAGYTRVYAQAEETRTRGTIPRTFITAHDGDRLFLAALGGAFDRWEEPA
jgi:peptidoglycan/xylan/chitin deacetylase (PgdA/CDA1 family)